jgi:hypothetical protein
MIKCAGTFRISLDWFKLFRGAVTGWIGAYPELVVDGVRFSHRG